MSIVHPSSQRGLIFLIYLVPDPFWQQAYPGVAKIFDLQIRMASDYRRTSGRTKSNRNFGGSTISGTAGLEELKTGLRETLALSASCSGSRSNEFFGGKWLSFPTPNPASVHNWLPNDAFCSSHMAICAEFEILEGFSSSQWR